MCQNCVSFTDCISETNNTQADNAKDLDVMMTIYSLIKYGYNYLKTSTIAWQNYRNKLALDNNDNIVNFPSDRALFKSKLKVTGKLLQ